MQKRVMGKKQTIAKRKAVLRIISFMMIFILFLLTFVPSFEAKAYSGRDKNGNISLSATGDIKINLLVAAIDPTLTSTDNKNYWNGKKKIKASEYFGFSLDESLNFWIDNFEEISHNKVEFNVVDTVIIDEFPKYTDGKKSLDNASFQKIFKKDANGYGDWAGGVQKDEYKPYDTAWELDYDYYIDKLNLVKRKNNNEFDMLFMIGIDPLSPCETCMVGRNPLYINGLTFERDCDNFVIVTPTFSRPDGSIENIGHMSEDMLGYTYGMIYYEENCIDGSDYSALNDWQKFCLCKYLATPETKVYGYGMVHFSPNSTMDYDWSNNTKVRYYKNWKEGKDIQNFTADTTYLSEGSKFNYYNDPIISHHRWWFYNMPYEDGRDKDGYYKSWWRYIFNPNYVTEIKADNSYPSSEIKMKVGDSTAVKFKVTDQADKTFTTDTKASSAAVNIKDTGILSFGNGQIKAKKAGKTTITVKLDGKSVKYTVTVTDKTEEDQVTAFVKRFYKVVLGRSQNDIDADVDGINYWVNKLKKGEDTGAKVAYGFVYSPEFQNKKTSNDEYVKVLYRSFFNRDPLDPDHYDGDGYNYWMNKLNSGTDRIDVLAGFTNSNEFNALCVNYGINRGELNPDNYRTNNNTNNESNNPNNAHWNELKLDSSNVNEEKIEKFVSDLYVASLGRSGDAGGIEYWKGCIINGHDDNGITYSVSTVISRGFFLSKEYQDMCKTDEEFTLDCYEAFFGRNPVGTTDEESFWYWVNRLKNGEISRQEMIEIGFGYSNEFKNLLVNTYGFRIIEQ